jgi:hypothetical protein
VAAVAPEVLVTVRRSRPGPCVIALSITEVGSPREPCRAGPAGHVGMKALNQVCGVCGSNGSG